MKEKSDRKKRHINSGDNEEELENPVTDDKSTGNPCKKKNIFRPVKTRFCNFSRF